MIDIKGLRLTEPLPDPTSSTIRVQIDEVSMTCRVTADTIARPSAPSGLNFTALGNGIFLDWNDNPVGEAVTTYHVYRSTSQGGPYSSLATPTASSYTDSTASANTLYWYHVTAVNNGGASDPSEISAQFTVDNTPPGVPVITATTQAGAHAVQIDWTPPTDSDLAGFNVYRATSSGGTYTKLNSTGLIGVPTFTDLAATAGSHWYYHVTSVDQTGNESSAAATDFNVPASDTTAPAVPTGVAGLDIHSAIRVTWTPNTEPDFASYSLYRSDDGYTAALATGLTAATYDDTTAVIGTPYSYKVTAQDGVPNVSAKSTASSAATRTATPASGNLTPFTNTGVGLMAPAVAHCRGVRFTQYGITVGTSPPATVTSVETNDFTAITNGDEIHARYEWNMAAGGSNPQGSYATGRGFNFAHVYDVPGTYTATLDRTDQGGEKKSFAITLVVAPDTRKTIYCASDGDGSSSNTGTDKTKPVNLARAKALLESSNAVKVLLRRGDTFNFGGSTLFVLAKDQQMVSSDPSFVKSGVSSNALPVLNVTSPPGSGFRYFFQITSTSHNAVVEKFQLSRGYTAGNSTYLNDVGIQVIGKGNTLIRQVVFNNIGKPIDGDNSGRTTRYLLVQDCSVPTITSMQYNFLFATGMDMCFFGNFIADSVQEHGIRLSVADRINISFCNITIGFANLSIAKNPINAQQGYFFYFAKNTLTTTNPNPIAGNIQIGPLNKSTATLEAYCRYIVAEDNRISSYIEIEDGASYVMVRNNLIGRDNGYAFQIYGHGEGTDQFGRALNARKNSHVYIYNNTLVNNGKAGQILRLKYAFDFFEFSNNLLIGPNLVKNDSGSIPTESMYIGGLGASNVVSRNIIPFAFDQILKGSTKYATAQFNQNGGSNNALDAVTVDGNIKPTFTKGQSTLARPIAGVFSSVNNVDRLSSDSNNTPGAYEL